MDSNELSKKLQARTTDMRYASSVQSKSSAMPGQSRNVDNKQTTGDNQRVRVSKRKLMQMSTRKFDPLVLPKCSVEQQMDALTQDQDDTQNVFDIESLASQSAPIIKAHPSKWVSLVQSAQTSTIHTFIESLSLPPNQQHDFDAVTGSFFYLLHCNDPQTMHSAYNLRLASHKEIGNRKRYFTVSQNGVTNFDGDNSDFTELSQWEREYRIFNLIIRIPFFCQYRRWKSFNMWKKTIRRSKQSSSRNSISGKLFFIVPSLRTSLIHVQKAVCQIASGQLMEKQEGQQCYMDLEEFVSTMSDCHQTLRLALSEISVSLLSIVKVSCDEVVDLFLRANNIVADHRMTFMERASLRSECRKLTRFLRLCDLMMSDALHSFALDEVRSLQTRLSYGADLIVPVSYVQDFGLEGLERFRNQSNGRTPLIRLEASLSQEGVISMTPTYDALMDGIHSVADMVLMSINIVGKISQHPVMSNYIMVDGDEASGKKQSFASASQSSSMSMKDLASAWPVSQDDLTSETLLNDDSYRACKQLISSNLSTTFASVDEFISSFDGRKEVFLTNINKSVRIDIDLIDADTEQFQSVIAQFKDELADFDKISTFADISCILVDTRKVKSTMMPTPVACLTAIRNYIPKLMHIKSKDLLDVVSTLNMTVGNDPATVEEYVKKKKLKDYSSEQMESFKDKLAYVKRLWELMDVSEWVIPDDDKAVARMMTDEVNRLEINIQIAESKEEGDVKRFTSNIAEQVPKTRSMLQNLRTSLDHAMVSDVNERPTTVIMFLQKQTDELEKLKQEIGRLQDYQQVLKIVVEEFEIIDEITGDLSLKSRMWKDFNEWGNKRELLLNTRVLDVNTADMEKELARYNKTAFSSTKGMPKNPIGPKLKSSVEEINPTLPIIVSLRNETLKERHWKMIDELVGFDIRADDSFTLGQLIERKVTEFQDNLQQIATAAQQESVLEEMMAKVARIWEKSDFEVKMYKDQKDLFILGDTSEVTASLDDSLVTINTVLSSRYVSGIRPMVDSWRHKLVLLQETLDEWLSCQKTWMYLENIFSAPDIVRQLPAAAKTFQYVDKSWRSILKSTSEEPNALKAATIRDRREVFKAHNEKLEQIQKELEDYLETKRAAFPRFYFLSNDELLEILSQAKEPRAVQPHLRKCFDNLVALEFGSEPGSADLIAMFSGEGERVGLGKNLKARGNVEDWLTLVEKRMKDSLRLLMKAGLIDYDAKPRSEWILQHPGQIVATVAQMMWARGTEMALFDSQRMGNKLKDWSVDYIRELDKLIIKIRGSLTKLQRMIIVALVTTDVHARDIIEELCEKDVRSANDFTWQQQLRYYWDPSIDDCVIRHSDSLIHYGYEYMGATSRLVITPLTDRCWLTLTGAYKLKLGGSPAGPAGTGKTESSKDLAKAMGILCVVFNCSDQIDYKMMSKLFRGLAQAGCWACLDEFNRIDIEVLSVIAQQLLVLREGRIMEKTSINFMGFPIKLLDHHVIITMNPGYAGRTELPDNLQVCFRPVSMMVPNYSLIAEIMLFAEGFSDAKNLSRKMCKLYILCSEQLSQQPHYDYGLRAVKSVLVMAGALKRANPTLDENLVLIRALRDSNMPKFLAEDIPLFGAIVQDLFPGVTIPSNDYGEFQVAMEDCLTRAGLQRVPKFMDKIIQMYDIFNIRFGATLVGPTGSGKSTCYKTLAKIMTSLKEQGSQNPLYQTVRYKILNPKCIAMGELYGEFNELTQEWHDGLAPTIMREYVADTSLDKRWTVFDGPIDSLWIESMNTVLDDNMTLCLANGERIKLKAEMKCLFEVQDLAVASPATVSRIGVVYMTPTDLGWMPYVESWFAYGIPSETPQSVRTRLMELFATVFAKGLAMQRKYCKEPVESVDIQLVTSLCALFTSLFKAENGVNLTQKPEIPLVNLADKIFMFCYVWSVGGGISGTKWETFASKSLEIFEEAGLTMNLSGGNTIYDLFVDIKNNSFKDFLSVVPEFSYQPAAQYFDLVVPTVDSFRFSYIMKYLLTIMKPVFLTGVTGTGKTVILQTLLKSLEPLPDEGGQGVLPVLLTFSAQTSSRVIQSSIEGKLEKKRKNLLGAPVGRKVVVFVDDVNMPLVETYGSQPPIELLRQILDHHAVYDRDKLFWKEIENVLLLSAAAPPGGGRTKVTPRFVRHFNVLCVPEASANVTTHIFSSIIKGFLKKFEPDIQKMSEGIVSASLEIYSRISKELLPTPSKFHYLFNLRDMSKVFQGVLMITPRKCATADVFVKLWIHESMRIFYDRLTNRQDQLWYEAIINELLVSHVKFSMPPMDTFEASPILFCDILRPDAEIKIYEEAKDVPKLCQLLCDYQDNYNNEFPNQINLVFFRDAMTHVLRISRILRQPRGNAILVGVGGSGKQSLSRIASFIAGFKCIQVEICRGYGMVNFREDIKKLMQLTGIEGKQTVFLFTDSQIVDESMLEDINNLLNSGEVPNLFPSDELEKIISDMGPIVRQAELPETRDQCLTQFVRRVRDNLHLILCMSPVGDALRIRCRQFPSLINCTTIDWFHPWPESALMSVAEKFLSTLELSDDSLKLPLVKMCGYIHSSIEAESRIFYQELRRRVYTTPKSYLDLISLYLQTVSTLQNDVLKKQSRMKVGVQKLEETASVVAGLKDELQKLEPVLAQKTIETTELLEQVSRDQAEADIVQERVSLEEERIGAQAEEVRIVQEDAQRDLDRALPALENATRALSSLTKADIVEVRSFLKPPQTVQTVMEAVCVMLGEKADWDTSKKVLVRSDFMDLLTGYDKDNIPDIRLRKLRTNYLSLDEMRLENVEKVSKAAFGMCAWLHAMNVYADVSKEVEPKKARLAEMNRQLDAANAILDSKRMELKLINDRVEILQKKCATTVEEKRVLEEETERTANRLVRAEKLISGLSSEGERWKISVETLSKLYNDLIGDTILSCGCVSYYGAFTGTYREKLISQWLTKAIELGIPCSPQFSLTATLGNPVKIREWQNQGLPTDYVSTCNSILVMNGKRWPLMIDPQCQANAWIRKMEKENLEITTMDNPNLLRTLENCIRVGRSLLVEDVGETTEPAIEPVLLRSVFKSGARRLIRLGDSDVDYDDNFKLYMTSKLPNPHYLPEVCIKVTLINFTVTMDGLQDQLLGEVVKHEKPEIEERKARLTIQMANDKKQLQELEAKILKLISESTGNILDDVVLINTLADSKTTANAISVRVKEAEITEQEILVTRNQYTSVAARGSLIYFVIADLAQIDPMYQYSLAYYQILFNKCIDESRRSDNIQTRLDNIMEYTTKTMYENICRGLFEKDKLLFSSLICFQILRFAKQIHTIEWNLFTRGAGPVDKAKLPVNLHPAIIPQHNWELICMCEESMKYVKTGACEIESKEPSEEEIAASANMKQRIHEFSHEFPFESLVDSVNNSFDSWKLWFDSVNPITAPLPRPFNGKVNLFQKLLMVKIFRSDLILPGIRNFVAEKLGKLFSESPSSTMDDIYRDIDNKTPCIFVLSSGADPTGTLLRFAKKMGYGERLHIVSLGQGQGGYAKSLIVKGCETGDWVLLQNCMLAKSWMPELERLVADLVENSKKYNPEFRLYLTSLPVDYFPVSVLQNGVKMTNEPPKGIRANVLRSFSNLIKEDLFQGCKLKREFKRLLTSLTFFHANIQERRKFGPLGWNIRYAFDESDLETSLAVLKRTLEEQPEIPWDALRYVTGHINYGGRVTDDWDRRALMTVLSKYMSLEVLEPGYKFSDSGIYKIPGDVTDPSTGKLTGDPDTSLETFTGYIQSLPIIDGPDIFGMHENANKSFNMQESSLLLATTLSLQPRSTGGSGAMKSSDEIVVDMANDIESILPQKLSDDEAGPTTFVIQANGILQSLAIVLKQEIVKFNLLLTVAGQTLSDIKKAIKGQIVMTDDLDKLYTAFLNNAVPEIWTRVSFASLKSLGSWVKDLISRISFMRNWLQHGQPASFVLPVFFFPQGFMTGTLQTYARKHMEAIDTLQFKYNVLDCKPEDIVQSPEDGVIIHGIYMEGGRWDPVNRLLKDPIPGEMFSLLPPIHFQPEVNHKVPPGVYQCPVYKTTVRKGVLSTTGLSTNFVVALELQTDVQADKWTLAGTAAICNLTD